MPARLSWTLATAVAVLVMLSGCGARKPASASGPRAIVEGFGRASAARDYQEICDHLIAPVLASQVEQIGLPCELAFKQGLDKVRAPKITIGIVRVIGTTAYVRVHSTAANQAPSDDTLKLIRTRVGWRIAALTAKLPPVPPKPLPSSTSTSRTEGIPPGGIPTG